MGVFPDCRVTGAGSRVYGAEWCVLETPEDVIRALVTYTDWWQPVTGSVVRTGRRHGQAGDGIHPGLLGSLDLREELCRRMLLIEDRDRELLYLWYVRQLEALEIAKILRISRRQCFRRRAAAIRAIADPEEPDEAERAS
jgi:DNA-directed RNA polymerase specialized sigma24 family protein